MTIYSNFYEETLKGEDFQHFTINQLIKEMHGMEDANDLNSAAFFSSILEEKGYKVPSYQDLRDSLIQQHIDIRNACLGKI